MRIYNNPTKQNWDALCKRPVMEQKELNSVVSKILGNIRLNGDDALLKYTKSFEGVQLKQFKVEAAELTFSENKISDELKNAIDIAYQNIYSFHQNQVDSSPSIETSPGIKCWRKSTGIERVGIYIPAGEAPLFSTVLMLGIPAQIAKCKKVVLCTPVQKDGSVNATILYAAKRVGIKEIYKIGGAQAIGAMAYGTNSIPKVDKIYGPGNQYVTKAKEIIQQQGVAIDLPAGPSEILVVADDTAKPDFIAADLLSQAEHGTDSQAMLVCTNEAIVKEVNSQLNKQLNELPRKKIIEKALQNSKAIVLKNTDLCIDFSNYYAPEHLIIATKSSENEAEKIVNAGSVFLGNYSCESAGDYATGTNHTLPTNGYAKNYSGVSLDSFTKKITFQKISKKGLLNIGETVELMAQAEQLEAHKNAVSIRLKSIYNEQT